MTSVARQNTNLFLQEQICSIIFPRFFEALCEFVHYILLFLWEFYVSLKSCPWCVPPWDNAHVVWWLCMRGRLGNNSDCPDTITYETRSHIKCSHTFWKLTSTCPCKHIWNTFTCEMFAHIQTTEHLHTQKCNTFTHSYMKPPSHIRMSKKLWECKCVRTL